MEIRPKLNLFRHASQTGRPKGCARDWCEDKVPRHAVDLEPYWIDRAEVTNAQFPAFLDAQGNQIEGVVAWLEIEDPKITNTSKAPTERRPTGAVACGELLHLSPRI